MGTIYKVRKRIELISAGPTVQFQGNHISKEVVLKNLKDVNKSVVRGLGRDGEQNKTKASIYNYYSEFYAI